MARKSTIVGGLQRAKPHPTLEKILSFTEVATLKPEEMTAWLDKLYGDLYSEFMRIFELRESISKAEQLKDVKGKRGEYVSLIRQKRMFPLIDDFLTVVDRAIGILSDCSNHDDVTEVFTQGVRVGMLHEKVLSLLDGRYQEFWVAQESRTAGGSNTKELTSDNDIATLRHTYAKFRGQVNEFEKTANDLHDRHNIKGRRGGKISPKTIERRLKELGEVDNT
jgi:hypothetical protein